MVVLDLPKYMNDVLHFSIQDNGFYSSMPQVMKLIMALATGALNDWLITANYLTITNGRKVFVAIGMYIVHSVQVCMHFVLFNSRLEIEQISMLIKCLICVVILFRFIVLASIFTGVFIIAASYAECDNVYAVAFFTISIAFQGVPGIAINTLDLSPNYAGILMGIGGAVTSITGIVVPYMVGVATENVSAAAAAAAACLFIDRAAF